jgi:hypothetical protein
VFQQAQQPGGVASAWVQEKPEATLREMLDAKHPICQMHIIPVFLRDALLGAIYYLYKRWWIVEY